jgi:signal transduction histidine kinase
MEDLHLRPFESYGRLGFRQVIEQHSRKLLITLLGFLIVLGWALVRARLLNARLKAAEGFRKRVFEASHVPVVVMEADTGKYVDCNPADGATWDAKVHLMSFESDHRRLLQFTLEDISPQKRAEADRARLEEQLRQSQKMEAIGRLAGGVAHDFNNMLTVIPGYAAMSKKTVPPGSRQHKYLAEIEKAGNRSKEITQNLPGFSRQQIIAPVATDLNELLNDLQEPLGRLIGEDIEMTFAPGKGLYKVLVDHSQVNQILLNLVVNARDAMPHGGRLMIETANATFSGEDCRTQRDATPGRYVSLSVSDTQVGIDAQTQARMFEPFFFTKGPNQSTKGPNQGTGLGLANVYGIAKQNGGFVNVYGEPGFGATFRIYIPGMDGEATAPEASGEAGGGDSCRRRGHPAGGGRRPGAGDDDGSSGVHRLHTAGGEESRAGARTMLGKGFGCAPDADRRNNAGHERN